MSELSIKPGASLGSYPQRREQQGDDLEIELSAWLERQRRRWQRRRYSQRYIVSRVAKYTQALQNCSDTALTEVIQVVSQQLRCQGLTEALMIEAFAVIREAAGRTLEKRHFDVQLYGGCAEAQALIQG